METNVRPEMSMVGKKRVYCPFCDMKHVVHLYGGIILLQTNVGLINFYTQHYVCTRNNLEFHNKELVEHVNFLNGVAQ